MYESNVWHKWKYYMWIYLFRLYNMYMFIERKIVCEYRQYVLFYCVDVYIWTSNVFVYVGGYVCLCFWTNKQGKVQALHKANVVGLVCSSWKLLFKFLYFKMYGCYYVSV